MSKIYDDIQAEMAKAVGKFPLWPTDMMHAFGIIGEEVGEAQKDILQYHYEPGKGKSYETIRAECVQALCMLMRFVKAMDDGHYKMPVTEQLPQSMGELEVDAPGSLAWAVARWNAEVAGRPLHNVHRRTLDDTWRQVIASMGGNPNELVGPKYDDLVHMAGGKPQT